MNQISFNVLIIAFTINKRIRLKLYRGKTDKHWFTPTLKSKKKTLKKPEWLYENKY